MGKNIQLKNVSKKYDKNLVLDGIDLNINAGERIVLLGPSGSGKSTLLRMIAGLETITAGELYLGDTIANDLECGDRDIAMVFQNYALYPHMTVAENVVFALRANKVPKTEITQRLTEALDILGLTELQDRLPRQLSGGQRQRTALARALVKNSDFFLLDEPLSNLDVRLRLEARKQLVKIHEKYQQTFVYVTHDQVEAMTIAHRIVVLDGGNIQMVGTPEEVYNRPANVFTAEFIGSPAMNIVAAKIADNAVTIAGQEIALSPAWVKHLAGAEEILFGIRAEHLRVDVSQQADSAAKTKLHGNVKYKELLGQNTAVTVAVGDAELIVLTERDTYPVGAEVQLTVDPDQMHFFDPQTKKSVGYPER